MVRLVCDRVTMNRKRGRVSASNCRTEKTGQKAPGFTASLSRSGLAQHNKKRAKRAAAARKRFQQPAKELAMKCRTVRQEGREIVGRDCTRPLAMGFGKKKRTQKVKRVVLGRVR